MGKMGPTGEGNPRAVLALTTMGHRGSVAAPGGNGSTTIMAVAPKWEGEGSSVRMS